MLLIEEGVFVQVAVDIDKMWSVCCCFISFKKIAWLWGLAVAIFVILVLEGWSYAFEIACEENLEVEKYLEKKHLQFFTFMHWLMVCSLKNPQMG